MKKLWLLACALLIVAVSTASATSWFPLREVRRHALQTLHGALPRYQVSYFAHENLPHHCVMLIADTETGTFDTVLLPMVCD